ncbi:MAG: efflux RND transporter periplasmic adaptor subunit [Phycisphaerae bacterium]|nr:efflux RND transporter periplasmic adaptor subunit [Phycisphaerae bacterium]
MKTKHKNDQTGDKGRDRKAKLVVRLFLVLALIGIAYGIYWSLPDKAESAIDEFAETKLIPVVVKSPVLRDFERRLVVQGNLEAAEYAIVSPRIQGTIDAIFVDEGASVVAGETMLFQIDKLNLEKAVTLRRHDLEVAKHAKRERAANLKRVQADFEKTELDYNRYERLFDKEAVTPDAFERQESIYKQAKAMLEHAQALVDLADEQEKQAEVALAMSEKDLDDAVINAPISGKISERLQEPGEMGKPGQPVVRIDNTSVIEASAYLPSQYYSKIIPGETRMNIEVSGIDVGQQVVSYRSPTIDHRLRTFEVKCVLKSPPEGVVPGAMAHIVIVLESRTGLGVPSEAIQERGGRSIVFVVRDGTSHEVSVTKGLETAGWTEILDSDLNEEASVVTMGQQMIDEGIRVSVQKE